MSIPPSFPSLKDSNRFPVEACNKSREINSKSWGDKRKCKSYAILSIYSFYSKRWYRTMNRNPTLALASSISISSLFQQPVTIRFLSTAAQGRLGFHKLESWRETHFTRHSWAFYTSSSLTPVWTYVRIGLIIGYVL